MKIKIDTSDIDRFAVSLKGYNAKINPNVSDAIRKSTLAIEKGAKANLTSNGSVKTGHLRRSLASKISMTQGQVHTSNVKYAPIVEKGSRPHIIRPKNGKALYWKGASHPVKMVRHPGSKAKPYLKPAFDTEVPNFIKNLKEAVKYKG